MENGKTLLEKVLHLKPQERFLLIDSLLKSLDEPDKSIDKLWTTESELRLEAHRQGKTKGLSSKDVLGEDI